MLYAPAAPHAAMRPLARPLPLARTPAARPSRPWSSLRVSAGVEGREETQHLFASRVSAKGWPVPKRMQGLHPAAQEAWESIHAIYGLQVFETPLVPAPWLADRAAAAAVHLKAENRQTGGSYRLRGAAHKLLGLADEQLRRGVVAAGSPNHVLAVAHAAAAAAKQRGHAVPARVFLPAGGAAALAERLRGLGAQVDQARSAEEAEAAARAAAAASGAAFLDAQNDPRAAGGLGSLAIELLMALPAGQLDVVFVPMGGGGLASSVAAVLKGANPAIRVVAARPAAIDRLRGVLSAPAPQGEGQPLPELVDEVVEVSEEDAARAAVDTTSHSGMQVDVATGVAVAAFQRAARSLAGKHVVVVVCGGNLSGPQVEEVYKVAASSGAAGGVTAAA